MVAAVLVTGAVTVAVVQDLSSPAAPEGIHKIKHIVIIQQENRSFDSYFGTYPGADGIPRTNGIPTVCSPNATTGACDQPYHDPSLVNGGGPHGSVNEAADVNGGAMDGFVSQAIEGSKIKACHTTVQNPACTNSAKPDVMGWHDAA